MSIEYELSILWGFFFVIISTKIISGKQNHFKRKLDNGNSKPIQINFVAKFFRSNKK